MSSKFLRLEDVLALHTEQIELFGGEAGVRDLGLLESAVEQPRLFVFGELLHPDIPSQAAAYLFHIAKNHAFVDGNKRTALAAALTFLHGNGQRNAISNAVAFELTLGVVNNVISKDKLIQLFRFPPGIIDSLPHWLEIAISALKEGVPVEEIPEMHQLAQGMIEAFLRSGVAWIGVSDQASAGYIFFDKDEITISGCRITTLNVDQHLKMAHLIGITEAEINELHAKSLPERISRLRLHIRKTFLEVGLQRLSFRSTQSCIGWRPKEESIQSFDILNLGHMPFDPEVLASLRKSM
ncbi:hypothetical protein GCM10022631_11480 [Deinococcus rubellus]|uniref:type II toxin-antitoxin system death-on-curing family toxin n=1 Tax=Deinococcus rubellus TaxID=1889240 RepID=UPI0031F09EF9